MNRLDLIKKAAKKVAAKRAEEVSFQKTIQNLDARKAAKKEELKLHKRLTKQVKRNGGQTLGSLEFNTPDNMYYSDKDNARFLENSSYMDAYNANRSADGDY